MITKYTTKSGSVYLVRVVDGSTEVMRGVLGQTHFDRGPRHLTKRSGDKLGLGVWRSCLSIATGGVGDILRIYFGPEDALHTNAIVSAEIE